jgi:hypothetical protein
MGDESVDKPKVLRREAYAKNTLFERRANVVDAFVTGALLATSAYLLFNVTNTEEPRKAKPPAAIVAFEECADYDGNGQLNVGEIRDAYPSLPAGVEHDAGIAAYVHICSPAEESRTFTTLNGAGDLYVSVHSSEEDLEGFVLSAEEEGRCASK